jgi:hypothetical protein
MPKIFLIKNRLQVQQQRLLESQKRLEGISGSTGGAGEDGGVSLTPPGSPLSPSENVSCQPLSLIVQKPANNAGKLMYAFIHNSIFPSKTF